ncbi:hypothetical protein LINPERPRIM_LOCUS4698 [Linum perenne]
MLLLATLERTHGFYLAPFY